MDQGLRNLQAHHHLMGLYNPRQQLYLLAGEELGDF
jgi:hypothetical protein